MSDPLAVLSLAVGSGGGTVDGHAASALVAAGLTLLQRSAPLVRALAGRRAAILLPTSPAFVTALAACEGRGAVLVNPLAAPPEIAYQLADANVGAVLTVEALAGRLPAGTPTVLLDDAPRRARVVVGGSATDVDLGTHFGLELTGRGDDGGRDEEAVIVYTSAMAGTALGAILSHRNLLANARACLTAMQIVADDHFLAVLPWAHLFGLTVTAVAPLLAGARVTTMGRFNPAKAADAVLGGDVTALVAVPAVFRAILAMLDRRGGPIGGTALRIAICGGAVLPVELQDRWFEATGVELRQGYGLTEAGPVCLFNRTDRPNVRGTLGYPFPDVDVTVRDRESGGALPIGSEGEICVRGDNVFRGYVGGGGGLERRDGWLHTGDLGVMNADGTVSFTGLCKPMFTRNGFNVYPREIERVVGAMPGVAAVTVRAVPEPAREHDILLEVRGPVPAADVEAWCGARLSAYKQPSEVRVTP